jgi:hypothetical protein
MGKRGPQPLVPSDEARTIVRRMSANGLNQDSIARIMGISVPTLEKYYREDLDTARDLVLDLVATSLLKKALSDDHPNAAASAMFWLKTRGRWRETSNLDLTSADKPIGPVFNMYLNPSVKPDPDPDG